MLGHRKIATSLPPRGLEEALIYKFDISKIVFHECEL